MSLTLTRRHNVDRFGYLIPTKYGNVPMVGAVATYRPGEGRFGRGAVVVEEGTTNLVTRFDGDFESYTIGESRIGGVTAIYSGTSYEVTEHPKLGKCLYVVGDSGASTARIEVFPYASGYGPANTEITISLYYVKDNIGVSIHNTQLQYTDGAYSGNIWTIKTLDLGGGVLRFTLTGTPAKDWDRILLYHPNGASGWLDKVQVEYKPFATSFVDGTRAAGRLSYPKSLVAGLHALTVAVWTPGPPYWTGGIRYLVAAQTTGASPYGDHFALRQRDNNRIGLWVRNDANLSVIEVAYDNVWDGNWHLIVGVINKFPQPGRQPIELYVDGELVASSSNINAVPDLSNIDETWGVQVGNWRGSLQWNGLIDELLILPYAASEEEIVSWYEAQGPLPPHPQALLQWDWQAVRPAQMVKL